MVLSIHRSSFDEHPGSSVCSHDNCLSLGLPTASYVSMPRKSFLFFYFFLYLEGWIQGFLHSPVFMSIIEHLTFFKFPTVVV